LVTGDGSGKSLTTLIFSASSPAIQSLALARVLSRIAPSEIAERYRMTAIVVAIDVSWGVDGWPTD
jgi:hypothetical protein